MLDFGMTLAGVSVQKTNADDRRKMQAIVGSACRLYDGMGTDTLRSLLQHGDIDVVLGGGGSRYDVLKAKVPWVEVNHERRIALSGYDGMANFAAAIAGAIASPIWDIVRAQAPDLAPRARARLYREALP